MSGAEGLDSSSRGSRERAGDRPDPRTAEERYDPLTPRREEEKAPKSPPAPSAIGPYRIEATLGEGGFGVVYLAEQLEPIQRRVAVKVVKPGMDSRGVVARFEQERQALAVMDHPHVARIFDAGATEDGRPYFVMEHVEGEPITEYCDRRRLGLRARLAIFLTVCEAVQHAHTKGVIHRDIKPANILVCTDGGRPMAKVIDFGIAKAMERAPGRDTTYTEQGVLMGTPEYMSPEQASLGAVDVDTRTDIYSLGVVLYELLAGALPFDASTLRASGFDEVRRIIREDDPLRPSARLAAMGDDAASIAEKRSASPGELRAALRRELEWIPLKALRKDRADRYGTPENMADDIRRYLEGRPLKAGPRSAAYRARKYMRRNRGKVLFAGALGLSLAAGVIATANSAVREAHMRLIAEENLSLAVTARERAQAAEKAAQRRAEELEQMASFQERQLSEIEVEQMGLRLRGTIVEARREALAETGADGAAIDASLGELEDSLAGVNFTSIALRSLDEGIFDRALRSIDEGFVDQPLVRARLLQTMANTLRELGLLERAGPPQEEALAIRRRTLGNDRPETLASIHSAGALALAQNRLQEAERFFEEAAQGRRRALGDTHPDTLTSIDQWAAALQAQHRFEDVASLYQEALAGRRRALGADHPDTLMSLNNMGGLLQAQGRLDEAEPFLREALEGNRRALGDDSPVTVNSVSNMGILLEAQGKSREAEPYLREALDKRRRLLGDEHPDTLKSVNNLGELLNAMGEYDEALRLLERGESAARRVWVGGGAGWLGNYLMKLGAARAGLGDWRAAESDLIEAHGLLIEGFGERSERTIECATRIVALYESWELAAPGVGFAARAETWRAWLSERGSGATSP